MAKEYYKKTRNSFLTEAISLLLSCSIGGGRRPLRTDEPLAEVVHIMGEIVGRSAGMGF